MLEQQIPITECHKKKVTRHGILDYETNLLYILESTTQQMI